MRVLLLIALACASAFAQSQFASLSGTIADASGSIVPGVDLKITNTETAVDSRVERAGNLYISARELAIATSSMASRPDSNPSAKHKSRSGPAVSTGSR